jgi:hypothetical protein
MIPTEARAAAGLDRRHYRFAGEVIQVYHQIVEGGIRNIMVVMTLDESCSLDIELRYVA